MLWDSDRLLWSFAFFVSSNVSSDNLPKHLTILSDTDNLFSYFSLLLLQNKARILLTWSSIETNWPCMSFNVHFDSKMVFVLTVNHSWSTVVVSRIPSSKGLSFLFNKLLHQAHDCREQITDTVRPVTIPNSCWWTLTVVYHSNSGEASLYLFNLNKFYYVNKHIFSCI